MAITGVFLGDYSNFIAETQKAEGELDRLQASGERASRAIGFVSNVQPTGIKQVTGATKELNDAATKASPALDQMASYAARAFTVGAVVGFTRQLLAAGEAIDKIAKQTGLAVDEVQELQYIAAQTNVPIGTLTGAVQNLTKDIGTRDKGLGGALAVLGITFEELQAATPYEAFMRVAEGVAAIEDPTQRATVAAGAFNRSWRELMPALVVDMQKIADEAPKMSEKTVAALAAIQARITWLYADIKKIGADILADLSNPVTVQDFLPGLDALPAFDRVLADMPERLKTITLSTAELAAEQAALAKDVAANKIAIEQATPAYKAWHAASEELKIATGGFGAIVDSVNGTVVEAIKYYLDAGVSQKTLADAYGLTAGQLRAIAELHTQEATAIANNNKLRQQQAEYQREVNAEAARYIRATIEADTTTRAHYENLAVKAAEAYTIATLHSEQYTSARLQQLRDESEAAQATLANWGASAEQSMATVQGAAEQATAALDRTLSAMRTTTGLAGGGAMQFMGAPSGGMIQEYFGKQYLVGPNGARVPLESGGGIGINTPVLPANWFEMLQGWQQRPTSSIFTGQADMLRTGGGAVIMQSGAVTMNYPIMNDPTAQDQIARIVGDGVMARLTRQGLQPS